MAAPRSTPVAAPPTSALLHAFRYNADELEEWHPATLAETRPRVDERHVLWINVNGTGDPETLRSLEADYRIHPLTIEDIHHVHQRPKVEEYADYLYVVCQMLKTDEDGFLDTEQVSMLIGDRWVVTLQEGKPGDVFEPVRERIRAGRPQVRANGPDYLAYAIMDAIVDAYFPILESFGTRAEALEEAILENDVRADVRENLQALRRDLLTLRRVAWPQRDATNVLERGETRWIAPATRAYFRDVNDHATRVIDFVETNRELVGNLMDLHLANVAARTNDVMKVLTVVSTIFIPLTFIVGLYGMNFENMPELRTPWGYPAVLVVMAALAVGMLVAFRRKGWV